MAKWRKITEIADKSREKKSIGKKAHWIQFKVYMQWTGAREFYDILVGSDPSTNV